MKDRIAECVHELFANTDKSISNYEIQEELIFNLCEKYDDLISEGNSEQTAFYKVISGIGDIDELIASSQRPSYSENLPPNNENRQDYIKYTPDPYQNSQNYTNSGQNPYQYINARQINTDQDDGMDEVLLSEKSKKLFGLTTSIMWISVTISFLIISSIFSFKYTWLMFILGAVANQLLLIAFYYYDLNTIPPYEIPEKVQRGIQSRIKGLIIGAFWTSVVIVYLVVSFIFSFKFSWMIFLIAAGFNQVILFLMSANEKNS